jgi:bifunctional DNA-binding transcriptional regulator/antitoxin component of YhaV-PrlF toxin-antitoxin module
MSKQAKTKVQKFGVGGMHIYIPADVRKDSQNPLSVGDEVIVSVDGRKLIVQPISTAEHRTNANEQGQEAL